MAMLLVLARAFINTFGITEPTHESERRAAFYIGGLLGLIVVGMVALLTTFIEHKH